jgi:hypothetical protein
MRGLSAAAVLRRASCGGAVDPGDAEPVLQGPRRRDPAVGESVVELDADEDGPPGGMVAFQGAGRLDQIGIVSWPGPPASCIAGDQPGGAEIAKPTQEAPDRGQRQVEFGGDRAEGIPLLAASEDRLANGDRDGLWHKNSPMCQRSGE